MLRKGLLLLALCAAAGCRQDMHDAPRVEAYEATDAFADGQGMRQPPENTVARGFLREDTLLYTGKVDGQPAEVFPFPVTRETLERGQDRYNAFCTPCHGATGMGNGMVVQRGFRVPPSFHDDRLRAAAPGHFFDVMTNGFGAMQDYRSAVSVHDRWAIAAYIRALQYSQRAALDDVPEDRRQELDAPAVPEQPAQPAPGSGH